MRAALSNRTVEIVLVVVACAAAFAGRLALAEPEPMFPDSFTYLSISRAMLDGSGATTFRQGVDLYLPPLYPLATALLSLIGGSIERSAVLVSALTGAATILPVWWLTRNLFGAVAAWIAVLLTAVNPLLVHWSTHALTESLFILLAVSAVAATYHAANSRRVWWWAVAGGLCGLAYLTRVTGMALLPSLMLIAVLAGGAGKPPRRSTIPTLVLCVGFALVTLPYWTYIRVHIGHWAIGGSYYSVFDLVSQAGSTDLSTWETPRSAPSVREFVEKLGRNTVDYAKAFVTAASLNIVFALVALLSWTKKTIETRRGVLLVTLTMMALVGPPILVESIPYFDERVRYVSPAIPFMLILSSSGMVLLASMIGRARFLVMSVSVGSVILSFYLQVFSVPGLYFFAGWKPSPPTRHKVIGEWMKTHLPPPLTVMTRKPNVPYYAGAVWHITPMTLTEVFATAKDRKIDYLVVDRGIDGTLRPDIASLLDAPQLPPEIRIVGSQKLPDGRIGVAVYRINAS